MLQVDVAVPFFHRRIGQLEQLWVEVWMERVEVAGFLKREVAKVCNKYFNVKVEITRLFWTIPQHYNVLNLSPIFLFAFNLNASDDLDS